MYLGKPVGFVKIQMSSKIYSDSAHWNKFILFFFVSPYLRTFIPSSPSPDYSIFPFCNIPIPCSLLPRMPFNPLSHDSFPSLSLRWLPTFPPLSSKYSSPYTSIDSPCWLWRTPPYRASLPPSHFDLTIPLPSFLFFIPFPTYTRTRTSYLLLSSEYP